MNNNKLQLTIGDPNTSEHATTHSRFVLPFAYKLIDDTNDQIPELYYSSVPTKPDSCAFKNKDHFSFIKRRKYFTRETSNVLYDKAIWAEVCDNWKENTWSKEGVTIFLRNKSYKIKMLPPRIVLFEATTVGETQPSPQSEINILQTGFLYIDIYFPDQDHIPELDDLLMFNEYFRYFDIPHNFHATHFKNMFAKVPTAYIDDDHIIEKIKDPKLQQEYYERWSNLLELPLLINQKKYKLLPSEWINKARDWTYNTYDISSQSQQHWQIYSDNRCYVWSAAILEKGGDSLRDFLGTADKDTGAHEYAHWIKLLNIDPVAYNTDQQGFDSVETTQSKLTNFEKDWADKRTYKRWDESGSWYGYSYHSGVMLGAPDYKNLTETFNLQYFDTTLLLFYLRMTLFRFSNKLSEIINHKQSNKGNDSWLEDIKQLRHDFSCFTIMYQFPLLSNQQQSLEMYEINRKYFDLDNLFTEIQSEINDTHNFLEQVKASEMSKHANQLGESSNELANSANLLTRFGIPLASAALVTSIFGMNINGVFNLWECLEKQSGCSVNGEAFTMIAISVMAAVVSLIYIWRRQPRKNE